MIRQSRRYLLEPRAGTQKFPEYTLWAVNQNGFPLLLNHIHLTRFHSSLSVSLVVFAISSVIISKHSQTASLNNHLSLITEGVNGVTNSSLQFLMNRSTVSVSTVFSGCRKVESKAFCHMMRVRLRTVLKPKFVSTTTSGETPPWASQPTVSGKNTNLR